MKRMLLGQVPAEETPAPPTSREALHNCRQLRATIRDHVGDEPRGCAMGIVLQDGRGYVLALHYSGQDERQQEYAESILWHAPLAWGASGRMVELGGAE